ncbi:MAG: NTP transferase domain-containing protein [Elusimicrobia bacterium]|nr:NTP transferase domain-containing protein [Elusimicrobiota bacterium]MDE2426939.1 NTP transferase domain-containing protein [Elusimicrobiota bacterium]
MQAVILAGGKGTRLRPFTATLPKPLVPVGDYPIIELVVRQLRRHGFRDIIVSTGHLAGLIEAYCGDGRRWGVKLRYVRESSPLSTAGALKLVRGLRSDFLTINGDILTTLDFRKLHRFHVRRKAAATVAVCRRRRTLDFGVIGLDSEDRLVSYDEKPSFDYLVSMGVNVFDRRALRHIGDGEALGIPELIARLRASGQTVLGFRGKADWLDIGRPDDYEAAQALLARPGALARYLRR